MKGQKNKTVRQSLQNQKVVAEDFLRHTKERHHRRLVQKTENK